jgi:hypothetical protein
MSAPGRRNLAGSLSKLSGGVQRIALTRVASPFARERGRVRVAPSEWCRLEGSTPHLSPLPSAKGRGETNTMGPTIGEHYRIGLKSYCQRHQQRARISAVHRHNYEIA